MGREVRRVDKDWRHPRDERGQFIPLYGVPWLNAWTEWEIGRRSFERGRMREFLSGRWKPAPADCTWEEWHGSEPRPEDYMPAEAFGDWFLMYETCSEGTPVTDSTVPTYTASALAWHLAHEGASFFGSETAPFEHWLAIAEGRDHGLAVFERVPAGLADVQERRAKITEALGS